jgi:hypothetical protein
LEKTAFPSLNNRVNRALNKILPYKKTMQHKEGPMVL